MQRNAIIEKKQTKKFTLYLQIRFFCTELLNFDSILIINKTLTMSNLAIFASGSGSNAENIVKFFKNDPNIHIRLILCNKPNAYVIERAKGLRIPSIVFNRSDLYENGQVLEILKKNRIDFIILSGFLWLIPSQIISEYPNRILNIHPALLPKFGGKGMYGNRVHEAVIKNHEIESGITIHYVNENYDEGNIVFQAKLEGLPFRTKYSKRIKHSLGR